MEAKRFDSVKQFARWFDKSVERPPVNNHMAAMVTPEMADELLTHNATNKRRIRAATVRRYARLMRAGEWVDNHPESIIIDSDGYIQDGQHRLSAMIESDTPIVFVFSFGSRPDNYPKIGMPAPRDGDDVFTYHEVPNARRAASITRYYNSLRNNGTTTGSSGIDSKMQLYNRYLEAGAGRVQYACTIAGQASKYGIPNPTLVGALFLSCEDKSKQDAVEFFYGLCTGENLKGKSPVRLVRDHLHINKKELNAQGVAAYIIGAWNATRANAPYKITPLDGALPKAR